MIPASADAHHAPHAIAPPLVDTHAHVYTTDMPLAPGAWHRPPHDATIEQYVATLDAHGVRFAVLAAASLFGDYNDYHIEAVRRHRARLRTTIIAHPGMDRFFLERMRDEGVVGIRLQWRYLREVPDLSAPEYRLLLRRVADLGWHVHIHDDSPRLPDMITKLEAAGIRRIVVDHFGRPVPQHGIRCAGFQAVLRALERGHTWVKLSAGYRLEPAGAAIGYARELLRYGGPERLLWGSDWPFAAFENQVRYADTISAFAQWIPDAEARRRIAGQTPLALYFS